ncbi:hypothetical protein F5878DRAFT_4414 [Lentinula raphanica]|uniref:FCP1 homology domain-containing protein n=1 Tax=Lentinula raphanica TaxID=153919 RepID=A0AA38UN60_9AGAR|nr:hypothetical protein F5878DRAFT_4414 [Lentinula raphanica]
MDFQLTYGYDYFAYPSSYNLIDFYTGSLGPEGIDSQNYQADHEARNEQVIHGGNYSQQQYQFERPHSRAYSNRSNRGAGRREHPTLQPDKIPVPSSAYLHLTEQPSTRLADPAQARKLLILDLNGTLLYREPRLRDGRDPYASNEPRSLRPTHPRPYIQSFKAFLFHPSTRKWLDTMVWSSAQYPNVKDMVGRCFGEEQVKEYTEQAEASDDMADKTRSEHEGLVAIWDRKFLGLSESQYRSKFQTTKDLAKPWALLPVSAFSGPTKALSEAWDQVAKDLITVENASNEPFTADDDLHLENTSLLDSMIRKNHLTRNEALAHSGFSTILLDDSPLKARMQPHNHICVPEYESKFFARDTEIVETRARAANLSSEDVSPVQRIVDASIETSNSEDVAAAGIRKRKRSRSPSPTTSLRIQKKYKHSYSENLPKHHDHILLAVIGLLDALKHESNVAAWIKDKGLFATNDEGYTEPISFADDAEAQMILGGKDEQLDGLYQNSVPEGIDGSVHSERKKKERRRNSRKSGRDSGITSVDSEQSLIDSSISFSESVEGDRSHVGVSGNTPVKDDDQKSFPCLSQNTDPTSCPTTPDFRDTVNQSGATTLPSTPPSARLKSELARKRHLLPRQERRNTQKPLRQSQPPTPNFVDSVYLYGSSSNALHQSRVGSTSSLNFTARVPRDVESDYDEKDIFSAPPASPPGLTGRQLDIDSVDAPLRVHTVEPIENGNHVSPVSVPDPLPSLWYQYPSARWHWVRRGICALRELGLEIIPGVETD